MNDLTDYILFKTKKCLESLCPCYAEIAENDDSFQSYAECFYYHSAQDKRRNPVLNTKQEIHDLTKPLLLAYQGAQSLGYPVDKEMCINNIEYLYYPWNFKAIICNRCKGFYCPFFHSFEEKEKWDILLRRVTASLDTTVDQNNPSFSILDNSQKSESTYDNDSKAQNQESTLHLYDDDIFSIVSVKSRPEEGPMAPIRQSIQNNREESISKDMELNHKASKIFDGKADEKEIKELLNLQPRSGITSSSTLEVEKENYFDQNSQKFHQGLYEDKIKSQKVRTVSEVEEPTLNNNYVRYPQDEIMPKYDIPFSYGSQIYYYGDQVDVNENNENEFKCFRTNCYEYIEILIEKYVCSFLNSNGGTIYLGVTDEGKIIGLRLDRRFLNELSEAFSQKLRYFSPHINSTQYSITANQLHNKIRGACRSWYVIQIRVEPGDPTELYFNDKKECYIRKQASSIFLPPMAIKDEIKARSRRQMARDLLGLMTNSGFEEYLKRQAIKDLEKIKAEFKARLELVKYLMKE